MSEYSLFIDDLPEGDWFRSLSPDLSDSDLIKFRNTNNKKVKELRGYDNPDVIVCKADTPVLVVERTRHKPTGENPLQRFARIVKAAQMGIPIIYQTPYARKNKQSHYNLNIRLNEAAEKVEDHYDTPILIPPWPHDDDYNLLEDGSENILIKEFLRQFFENGCDADVEGAQRIRKEVEREKSRIIEEYAGYKSPPPKVNILSTNDWIQKVTQKSGVDDLVRDVSTHDETVVVNNDISKEEIGRVDPYGGAQFVYDYAYCRQHPEYERDRNLILRTSTVTKREWLNKAPYNPENKTALWYKCADAIELSNSVLYDFDNYRRTTLRDF